MKNNYRHRFALAVTFALLTYTSPIFSQNLPLKTISGTITDADGPLNGVNVLVKNTSRGSVSDLEGRYALLANSSDTLVFTYLGYKTQEVAVGSSRILNVNMQADATALDQVVINAGYYKVSDKERTGSIARMTAKEIENQPVNNPLEALQGRMAGVNIMATSGVPGGGFNVRIRGQNSIMAGNEPLYIIDGIPFDSQSLGSPLSSAGIIPVGAISPLNAINPASIESIEVLKDADATAIYGSRGANGVVLITTKKGKAGKTKFSFSSSTGIAHITQKRELLNTEQYLEMRREAFANDGITEYPEYAYDVNGRWNLNRYTDWQDVLIGHTANIHKVQGSVSGGSEGTRFLLTGMYQNETSVFPGSFNYDRITVNSSLQHKDRQDKFKLDFNAGYTLEDNFLPGSDLSDYAVSLAPNAPALYDTSGNLNWEDGTWNNPLAQFENKYKNKSNTLFTSLSLSYKLVEQLDVKLNSGYGASSLKDHVTAPHTAFNPAWGMTSANSMVTTNEGNKKYWILEPQLNWKQTWENGVLNILLGGTFQKQQFDQYGVYGIGFPTNSFITNLSAATTILVNNEVSTQYNTQSWFTRINYALKNKLFLNITGRRDGSSRFGSGNKYGNFGALGAAYVFSDDLNLDWLNFGKIRGSYGITGNDQIGDYQYLQTYTITGQPYDGNIGLQPARLYNPNFKWEENRKSEIALEMGFLKNKIALSVAYYNNRSSNQLINYSLPTTTGFSSILANLDAEVENKGWEFDLKMTPLQTENFKWTSSINLSLSKNKLLAFPGLETSAYANKYVIGESLYIVKLYKLKGVNPQTGLFEFEDYNNDGQLTGTDDREYVADLTPKYFGGFSNFLSYKNWELDIFFQFVKKKGYNQYRATEPVGTMANQSVSVLDRWQQPGDVANMQRFTTGADPDAYTAYYKFIQSNGIISDASFIRLKSLALAYTLSLGKASNTSCRLLLTGQNLLTITKFEGGDPEQMDGNLPPLTRLTFGFQLNL
ncbi:SusC/RagA family TonB-linked outer membrane protein [Aequorivita todarodis]|uniref:SusC/RagA family TonB-linked outer membrane protein n=1 Tax=Aequorivita todarodis TaxID=2036821 RepID=UPI00235016D0|nr:SusC/RagA family TonB-linked outer membrane protein [Aequorivita todarodis]MDC8000111.1 SusC/RagA family TonB-linked outer membrane protein [Aequorivita todarodis]